MTKEQFNALPRPTFRWMKVNHLELDPLAEKALAPVELAVRQEGTAEVRTYEGNGLPDLGDFQGASAEALAQALREGHLGVMDYYQMKNLLADTKMRESLVAGSQDELPPTRKPEK